MKTWLNHPGNLKKYIQFQVTILDQLNIYVSSVNQMRTKVDTTGMNV